MKKEHTTKNPLKKLSLQWRLTLIITLLMTVTCVLMYFFISNSAVTGIENLGDYVVKINETDSTPITLILIQTLCLLDFLIRYRRPKICFAPEVSLPQQSSYFSAVYVLILSVDGLCCLCADSAAKLIK